MVSDTSTVTPTEQRVLALVCIGEPNKVIAHHLSMAETTVKSHIAALMRKYGVHNRTRLAYVAGLNRE